MTKKNYKKVNLTSSTLSDEQLSALRKVLPEAFGEDKIDWDKFRAALGDTIDTHVERFGFMWAGKSGAVKNVLIPSKATLKPAPDESVNFDTTENLFIEGDNLEALKLLQKAYFQKVKMIYIDPPYNTGNDFVYSDDFKAPLQNYLAQTGQKDGNGHSLTTNRETSGRYHSDWLNMMYPRLKIAWSLLRDDGVIFISIDDNEVHHLRMMMDEIFGEENFEGHIHWRRRHNQPNDPTKLIALVAEHILVYAKDSKVLKETGVGKLPLTGTFSNPDNDPRGDWNSKPWKVGSNQSGSLYLITLPNGESVEEEWMGEKETYKKLLADNRIYFPKDGGGLPRKKIFKSEREEAGQSATNWFENGSFGNNQEASVECAELFDGNKNIFDNPKPTKLLKSLLLLGDLKDGDIVLDFFAGSGTTAHAVMAQNAEDGGNRKWICVQLPEQTPEDSEARKAGYKNIADISRERIRRAIKKLDVKDGFKVFKLAPSNYPENLFEFDPEKSEEENTQAFTEYLERAKRQSSLLPQTNEVDVVYENIIKEGLSLNSTITEEKIADNKVYVVRDSPAAAGAEEGRELRVCLDAQISKEAINTFTSKMYKSKLFICLDTALDDTAKANLGLNVELKTI